MQQGYGLEANTLDTDNESWNTSWTKENPNNKEISSNNRIMKCTGRHHQRVQDLTHHRAIKEEIIAINHDWVKNLAYSISHNSDPF